MALIPFSLAPRGHSAAYLIHSSPMLTALESLFDAEWERAVPITPSTPPDSAPPVDAADDALPDAETRALLNLLSSGLSDSAIARSQGWSPRTTQRRIQRLMTELGAASRFQAALMAARRGWI
jgi:DNA-binding NarL/FixJ family response regulator